MCKRMWAERSKIVLRVDFIYGYYRRGEEVIKEMDRDVIKKGKIREVNRNEGVRVLGRDDFFDLC